VSAIRQNDRSASTAAELSALLQPACIVSPDSTKPEVTDRASVAHITPIIDRVDPSVPTAVREKLQSLLTSYEDVFSKDEYDLGHTSIVQHSIDTAENRPFRQPLRPQPRAQLPIIDKLLDEMQQQGVIEPCQSNWASNIVLVKKKDGSIRFCVDYRKLNTLTTKDAYPLPRIDSCLDTLSGAAWYSTFDLRSGFHQVAMDPRDANKTTFICHRGTYRFPKMPFGLCNAPATFQRLMDTVLSGTCCMPMTALCSLTLRPKHRACSLASAQQQHVLASQSA